MSIVRNLIFRNCPFRKTQNTKLIHNNILRKVSTEVNNQDSNIKAPINEENNLNDQVYTKLFVIGALLKKPHINKAKSLVILKVLTGIRPNIYTQTVVLTSNFSSKNFFPQLDKFQIGASLYIEGPLESFHVTDELCLNAKTIKFLDEQVIQNIESDPKDIKEKLPA